MNNFNCRSALVVFLLMFLFSTADAKVSLPAIFGDHMVLQQQTKAALWGKSAAYKSVRVFTSWDSKRYTAVADQSGNWKLKVATPAYGGPYVIKISDGEELLLQDVLIGDVWICSGQSNMEMPLAGWGKIKNYQQEIAAANYPKIRLLQVQRATGNLPLKEVKVANNGWQQCTPQYIADFSSTAYFFARSVYKKTGIPIGLIHTSWGGTLAEAWTSASALQKMPYFMDAVQKVKAAGMEKPGMSDEQKLNMWLRTTFDKDSGYQKGKPVYPSLVNTGDWKTMKVPGLWEEPELKDMDGVVWLTRKINIPKSWLGKSVKLNLNTIDDNDITWVNGVKVGETSGVNQVRQYVIPAKALKTGTNTITVRIFDSGGGGGFFGEAKEIRLINSSGETIPLSGDWLYKVGLDFKNIAPMPASANNPDRPTVLYNAMIHPLIQLSIKGVIWYQGESNVGRAFQYQELFPAMIRDWRQKWAQGDFPFYFVQLASFMKVEDQPVESSRAELREAQLKTLSLPKTGMAVTIDIGDANDIHPKNKQEVGRRLALIALAKDYHQKVAYTGPVYLSQKIEDNAIRIHFKISGNALKTTDGKALTGFSIAGEDKEFYWAKAVISGNQLILKSDKVPHPVAIRYGWAENPVCNLTDGSGLPASPFRTDDWGGVTFWTK